MNSASSFKEFYESSILKGENPNQAQKLAGEFFADFIKNTPLKLKILESHLSEGQIEQFYNLLPDLKYLIEFSDDLNRYWHLLRAYSGALSKLKNDLSVKGAKNLYAYYFSKYGDRRFLRNEHWFEKKRWEFLDEIQSIYSEDQLRQFYIHYQRIMDDNMKIYSSFIMLLINDLENLIMPQITIPSINKVK